MQGTLTPNGYTLASKTSGAIEDYFPIPAKTRRIEVWATSTLFIVGVSSSTADMLGSQANTGIVMAGAASPFVIEVNPQSSLGISGAQATPAGTREFTYIHFILGAASNGIVYINFFR